MADFVASVMDLETSTDEIGGYCGAPRHLMTCSCICFCCSQRICESLSYNSSCWFFCSSRALSLLHSASFCFIYAQ